MNPLDRMIGLVAPRTAVRRAAAREALGLLETAKGLHRRNYDGAGRGRRVKNWRPGSGSANAAIEAAVPIMRDRARDLVRNNPWAARAVGAISSNLVGTGIRLQGRAPQASVIDKVEEAWRNWADSTDCDADGRLDFYGIQELVSRSVVESGEVLVRRRVRRAEDGLTIPMQLQVLEPDFLDTTKDTLGSDGKQVIHGIQFDKLGRREGYWLYTEHPGEVRSFRGLDSRFVRASEIAHIYRVDRPGQVSGVTWLAPALVKLRELKEYDDAELVRQKIAACFSVFVTRMDNEDAAAPTTDTPEPLEQVQPGIVEYLEPGEDVSFANPSPPSGYDMYTNAQLRGVAAALEMPFEVLASNYSQVNFSSGRMGWIEFDRKLRTWRSRLLVGGLCRQTWLWAQELLPLVGVPVDGVTVGWTQPRREMIDPSKEFKALIEAVRGGVKSWPEVVRELGGDPEETLAEIEVWQKLLTKRGIVMEADARVGKSAPPAPKAKEPDEGDEKEGEEEADAEE